ncbi:MAG: aromatic ring-hydroxylating dioxygenase subunit alpha [Gammaproteobacteria bacterium]|nr:aromatic ring-hydroxylating dioxygenase subunit alpha [Gammaproteobacteria bacterium]NNC98152.1 aromatic ring-hydroxylating dioxygenase subunit alpha [Gammaproteobacteria bacterium]NNM13683.1 aromatic ring-hydroxylating dioxygenase subunit alpha [Gammaproteobacteria bacterium]
MTHLVGKEYLAAIEPVDHNNAHTLPAFMYLDEDILGLEKTAVLENSWQLVGHVSQLQRSGDHIVAELGNKPVIVVRNADNEINAFINVCRHRGGPLAYENGHSNMLVCKYHGWTYTLDGALKVAPEMNNTPNFDTCQFHLPKVKHAIWQNLVFVNVSDTAVVPKLETMLDGIAQNIVPIDLAQMQFSHSDTYYVACNWKVYMDNYLEGYHLPMVHPELNKMLDYRSYQTTLHPWYSYQFSPLEQVDNPSNFYGEGKAHYYCVFPNLMLNILPGRLQTNRVSALNSGETLVTFDYFYSDIDSQETQQFIEQDIALSDEIQKEDIQICEAVQKGLQSGCYEQGRLNMLRETGVLHFQELLRQQLRLIAT